MSWTISSWPTSPYLSLECSHLWEKPERGANHCPLCSADYKSKAIIQLRCFDTALDSPPSLSEASHFQIFNPAASNLTDSPLFQVEHIYLPGPTDWDGGADRLTPGSCPKIQNTNCSWYISSPDTRRLSWKRNFTRITTSRGDAGSRWPTSCVSQRDKSKFGSRTGEMPF